MSRGGRFSPQTVSYTHLDVYKRQILVGLVGAFGCLDYQLGTLYAFRPIVLCPLVGLVLGDLQTCLFYTSRCV